MVSTKCDSSFQMFYRPTHLHSQFTKLTATIYALQLVQSLDHKKSKLFAVNPLIRCGLRCGCNEDEGDYDLRKVLKSYKKMKAKELEAITAE